MVEPVGVQVPAYPAGNPIISCGKRRLLASVSNDFANRLIVALAVVKIDALLTDYQGILVRRSKEYVIGVAEVAFPELEVEFHKPRNLPAKMEQAVGAAFQGIVRKILLGNFAKKPKCLDQIRFARSIASDKDVQPSEFECLIPHRLEVLNGDFFQDSHGHLQGSITQLRLSAQPLHRGCNPKLCRCTQE